ncbi:MAG: response regulator [Alphaproteobacteria bacterium]|nr:response regulator [Alphaproteobacteria bacterium]
MSAAFSEANILIVEDNENFSRVLDAILRGVGIANLRFASGGAEALAALAEAPADVVFCDWRLEGMDGITFVRTLRGGAEPKLAATPVIMVTGHGDDALRAEAEAAGVTAYLEKPLSMRALLSALAEVMRDRGTA